MRVLMRKVFPDHWSFMLGEIALWSFVILLLTGTFLSLFFTPSMTDVTYHGSYVKLDGIRMNEAYASTLNISFDVRGGLVAADPGDGGVHAFGGAVGGDLDGLDDRAEQPLAVRHRGSRRGPQRRDVADQGADRGQLGGREPGRALLLVPLVLLALVRPLASRDRVLAAHRPIRQAGADPPWR